MPLKAFERLLFRCVGTARRSRRARRALLFPARVHPIVWVMIPPSVKKEIALVFVITWQRNYNYKIPLLHER